MDLLDQLLGHDAWTTRQLLAIAAGLSDQQLDREFDIGHRTLRNTFDHIISNMEIWLALMAGHEFQRDSDCTIPGFVRRLSAAGEGLQSVARWVAENDAWDDACLGGSFLPPS